MSMAVQNDPTKGFVKKMAVAGAITGGAIGIHKSGVLKGTLLADCFTKESASKFGAAWKNGKKDAISKAWKKLCDGTKEIWNKGLASGKRFWGKDWAGKGEALKGIVKNPATWWAAGITAGFIAVGAAIKGIVNHNKKAA